MNALALVIAQNAVIASMMALAVATLGRMWKRPAIIHTLWVLVLLKLVTPPVLTIPVDFLPNPFQPTVAAISVLSDDAEIVGSLAADASQIVATELTVQFEGSAGAPPVSGWLLNGFLCASLLGTIVYFVLVVVRVRAFDRLLSRAKPVPPAVRQRAHELSRSIGLARCPPLLFVAGQVSPMVWAATGKTRIIMPAELFQQLDEEAQSSLLVHELAHVRRRDHWVRCLEALATGFFWWHPVVWLAKREIREAEELCCDGYVLRVLPRASRSYACALVDTVDFLAGSELAMPPAASGVGATNCLKRRIEMVMSGTDLKQSSGAGRVLVVATALLVLPLGASWAENGGPSEQIGDITATLDGAEVEIQLSLVAEAETEKGKPDSKSEESAAHTKLARFRTLYFTLKDDKQGERKVLRLDGTPVLSFTKDRDKSGHLVLETHVKHGDDGRKTVFAKRNIKSLKITYADGTTEEIELAEVESLTIRKNDALMFVPGHRAGMDVTTFSLSLPHGKVNEEHVLIWRGEGDSESGGLSFQPKVSVGVIPKLSVEARPKAKSEDRLQRIEQMLEKLQAELKALKNG